MPRGPGSGDPKNLRGHDPEQVEMQMRFHCGWGHRLNKIHNMDVQYIRRTMKFSECYNYEYILVFVCNIFSIVHKKL